MPSQPAPRRWSSFALAGLIAVCLAIGLLVFRDYGVSWDEPSSYQYGREALSAYAHPLREPLYTDSDGLLKYYGAAYLLSGAALARALALPATVAAYDGLHLFNFITFLAGLLALHALLSRWVSQPAALGTLLLFASQPLLWGHAFINPKDSPFMALFLISLALGLRMLDAIQLTTAGWVRALPITLLAGFVLGFATSTRIVAPLAGLIISLLVIWRVGRRALPLLALYWLCALLVMFATWPFLWPDPFNRLLASLRTMTAFPWNSKVLFDGLTYKANNLPWRYVPKLLTLQFTEPALLLSVAGAVLLAGRILRLLSKKLIHFFDDHTAQLAILLAIWFVAPLTWIILTRPTLYDNFRQFLFITPPLFILAALALHELFKIIRHPWLRAALLLLTILPGMLAGLRLHPYEYTYYNSLAGEVAGRYETDYWATSFREAAGYINANAPQNAVIAIGPWGLIREFLRTDLQVERAELSEVSDYVIIFTRWDYDKNPAFTGTPVYTIERSGARFLTIQRFPR